MLPLGEVCGKVVTNKKQQGQEAMKSMLAMVCLLAACSCATNQQLGAKLDKATYWRSQQGEQFVARYGALSDDSLRFVKVTMPDGREVTLPQAISASGARYTDEKDLVWWEHQGTVRVDVRREDGKWDENHWELRPDPQAH